MDYPSHTRSDLGDTSMWVLPGISLQPRPWRTPHATEGAPKNERAKEVSIASCIVDAYVITGQGFGVHCAMALKKLQERNNAVNSSGFYSTLMEFAQLRPPEVWGKHLQQGKCP